MTGLLERSMNQVTLDGLAAASQLEDETRRLKQSTGRRRTARRVRAGSDGGSRCSSATPSEAGEHEAIAALAVDLAGSYAGTAHAAARPEAASPARAADVIGIDAAD